jgi:ubiquinone/menaquinone biosynthesis C-methylase UbiE
MYNMDMPKSSPPVCNYEGSDYQRSFWEKGGRAYEDAVEEIALKQLLPKSGKLLLELGAGAGRNTPRYAGYERVVLLDYSTTQLAQARERLGDGKRFIFVAADIYHMPFVDALFDGATMIRTLHHMADAPAALLQVANVLQMNSTFILEFANKRNLKAVGRYLLGRQKWNPFSPEPVEFEKLNFDFHPKTIRRWLRETGFSVRQSLSVSHFRMRWLKRHIPLRTLAKLDGALQWTGSFCQYTPSVFTRSILMTNKPNASPDAFFKCPKCGSMELNEGRSVVHCRQCNRLYPIKNGIYDFRME